MHIDLSRRLLLSISAGALAAAMPHPAQAGDFVVDFPSAETNGGFVIDGGDTLTIGPDGSIAPAAGEPGATSQGGNNVIVNLGSVSTLADYANAVENIESDDSVVTNEGSVFTQGDHADGLYSEGSTNAPVSNGGSIRTLGENSHGIYVRETENSDVTNRASRRTASSARKARIRR